MYKALQRLHSDCLRTLVNGINANQQNMVINYDLARLQNKLYFAG